MADIKNERPYEEYIGLFKEAIHKSHGLCNNRIGQEIAKREGATVVARKGNAESAGFANWTATIIVQSLRNCHYIDTSKRKASGTTV